MPEYSLVLLPVIGFLVYTVKAITGFGTAIVFVALGSLLIGTRDAVILCAALDTVGGGAALYP